MDYRLPNSVYVNDDFELKSITGDTGELTATYSSNNSYTTIDGNAYSWSPIVGGYDTTMGTGEQTSDILVLNDFGFD